MENTTTNLKRSQKLTKGELAALKAFIKSFDNQGEAADAIGIDRPALSLIIARKTARTTTIEKINKAIAAKTSQQ